MKDWSVVYKSTNIARAEIVKGVLIDRQIDTVIINKQDSAYKFGQIEVLVRKANVIGALKIINDEITFG